MAPVIVILGSMVGFCAGLVGWLALDLPLVAALAIWLGAGPVSAGLAALFSLLPHGARAPQAKPVLVKA